MQEVPGYQCLEIVSKISSTQRQVNHRDVARWFIHLPYAVIMLMNARRITLVVVNIMHTESVSTHIRFTKDEDMGTAYYLGFQHI